MKTTLFGKHLLLVLAAFLLASAPGPSNGQEQQQQPTDQESLCVAESAVLNTNANISAATQELMTTAKDEMLADFYEFCRLVSLTCTADISTYSGDLRASCQAENGQLAERDVELNCVTNTSSPVEIPGTVKLLNLPACVGASCDLNNLPPEITQVLDEVVASLNTEVDKALGDQVTCQVATASSGASLAMGSFHAWDIFAGTLSLIAILSLSC